MKTIRDIIGYLINAISAIIIGLGSIILLSIWIPIKLFIYLFLPPKCPYCNKRKGVIRLGDDKITGEPTYICKACLSICYFREIM